MELFLALTPILVVLVGIVVLKKPAMWVSVIALVYTIILGILYFGGNINMAVIQTTDGVIGGVKMVYMIWAAFLILNMLIKTGAMDKIKEVIGDLTSDRRKQVIIVAFCFGGFLEGVAGAGTPAAIAAPFLVALGLNPIAAATAALICNGVPSSWGAAGLSTIGGFTAYIEPIAGSGITAIPVLDISGATGRIHIAGALIVPFITLFVLYGRKAFDKGIVKFLVATNVSFAVTLYVISAYVGAEFTSIFAGLVSLFVAIGYIKLFCKEEVVPEEFLVRVDPNAVKSKMPVLKALSTYIILLVALPLVRFNAPQWFLDLGFNVWIGTVILCVCIVGSLIYQDVKSMPFYMKTSFLSVIAALVAMCSLLALSNIMKSTGMLSLIAKALVDVSGVFYPALAVVIGSLGSFMAGTTTGSNIMFAPMHYEAANLLGVAIPNIFAANSAGGALGNMICTNNVVAVCATVGLINSEGMVMRNVLKPICFLWVIYGGLAMLYTYILFPII